LDELDNVLTPLINLHDHHKIRQAVQNNGDPTLVAAAIFDNQEQTESAERIVASTLARQRIRLERRLTFLGTLGNNAPFIGLLGTVLGIIRAFHELSLGDKKGASAVMAGISEALVATAIGLFVAIPAVIAFNYFQRQVDRTLSTTEALAQSILAWQVSNWSKQGSQEVSSEEK
ncbi:MAG: MotA/TolQ/ExbB proton channel family protein, partial [Pseudomonadota bacterium]